MLLFPESPHRFLKERKVEAIFSTSSFLPLPHEGFCYTFSQQQNQQEMHHAYPNTKDFKYFNSTEMKLKEEFSTLYSHSYFPFNHCLKKMERVSL